jgi:hypothetical protein
MTTLTPTPAFLDGHETGRGATGWRSRLAQLVGGRSRDRTWELLGLALLLTGAAILYLWNLGASGWANSYTGGGQPGGTQVVPSRS